MAEREPHPAILELARVLARQLVREDAADGIRREWSDPEVPEATYRHHQAQSKKNADAE
jgi:hypothetical protein